MRDRVVLAAPQAAVQPTANGAANGRHGRLAVYSRID